VLAELENKVKEKNPEASFGGEFWRVVEQGPSFAVMGLERPPSGLD
jgi:hypothetical protein